MFTKSTLYKGTKVNPARTIAQVDKLLRRFGIFEQRITKSIDGTKDFLEFIIRQESRPPIKVMIKIPFIERYTKYGSEFDAERSYRYFYHYLKALMSAKETEMYSIEEIFMGHIVQPLIDGRETTLGQQLVESLDKGNLPALEGFSQIDNSIPKLELIRATKEKEGSS